MYIRLTFHRSIFPERKQRNIKFSNIKFEKKKKEREKEILDVSRAMLFHTAFNQFVFKMERFDDNRADTS